MVAVNTRHPACRSTPRSGAVPPTLPTRRMVAGSKSAGTSTVSPSAPARISSTVMRSRARDRLLVDAARGGADLLVVVERDDFPPGSRRVALPAGTGRGGEARLPRERGRRGGGGAATTGGGTATGRSSINSTNVSSSGAPTNHAAQGTHFIGCTSAGEEE
jgi:hypothetical protein